MKPENILLVGKDASNLDIKMADFGISCIFNPDEGLDTVIGTPFYMSPEQCRAEKYDTKIDIWAFGIICYEILNADIPFPMEDDRETQIERILNWDA
jgi:serine/threonine protein kinase